MPFELPALPYEKNALEPWLSSSWVQRRYEEWQRDCLEKLNVTLNHAMANAPSLETLMQSADETTARLAAEAWALTFYWHGLAAKGAPAPSGELSLAIDQQYGGLAALWRSLEEAAQENTTAHWTWLKRTRDGSLIVRNNHMPFSEAETPLLVIESVGLAERLGDARQYPAYLGNVRHIIHWDFVEQNLC